MKTDVGSQKLFEPTHSLHLKLTLPPADRGYVEHPLPDAAFEPEPDAVLDLVDAETRKRTTSRATRP